jgi:zinc transport system ATP-binding protein
MSQIILDVQSLSYNIKNKVILDNINFQVKQKEVVTIIGPNGAGKSTLAAIITGIIKNYSGNIIKSSNLNIGYMPQILKINDNIPMNVQYFLTLHHVKNYTNEDVISIASKVGISHLLKQQITSLSVGEMQRASLARCLLNKPNLLVLDEPEQGVDINRKIEIYSLLNEILNDTNIAIIIISHDFNFVMSSTNKVICLNKHICCSGVPKDISKNPEYIKLFGNHASQIFALYSHDHDHSH